MVERALSSKTLSRERGFALLYTLLVVAIFLSITATIYTILIKELKLAQFGEASQQAYYAAEAGAECAYFWVFSGAAFDGSEQIRCAGRDIVAETEMTILLDGPSGPCAFVEIAPNLIRSHGYNTCASTGLRVERGLQVVY
jgi:hypothetical protein